MALKQHLSRIRLPFIVWFFVCIIGFHTAAVASTKATLISRCSPHEGQKLDPKQLERVIANHAKWLGSLKKPPNQLDPKRDAGVLSDPLRANLCKTRLSGAVFKSADLTGANFDGADLANANFSGANLSYASLRKADLRTAVFADALLIESDLTGVRLDGATLKGAALQNAQLTNATLVGANLQETFLVGVELKNADLAGADLGGAVYEVRSQPQIGSLVTAHHLDRLVYGGSQKALIELRKDLNKAGMRTQERQITYAIKRTERLKSGPVESALNYVFFELTCGYGRNPGRPLAILVSLILFFMIFYVLGLANPNQHSIWRVWADDRVLKENGTDEPERIHARKWTIFWYAFYFSILMAFNIGWRELNVGSWIARIQPREYTLRATGWVRSVAGIQSLISVYLVALSALAYFGRPFG